MLYKLSLRTYAETYECWSQLRVQVVYFAMWHDTGKLKGSQADYFFRTSRDLIQFEIKQI